MNKIKELRNYIRRAMNSYKGDDLERAELSFKNLTPKQMDQGHGCSGKTKRQILEEYREERKQWQEANKYLEELFEKEDKIK